MTHQKYVRLLATHWYMLLIEARSAVFSLCRLTMLLRRTRRFLHVWFTAPPLFPASLSSPQSCSTLRAWPILHTGKEVYFPDLRPLPPSRHIPPRCATVCFLVLAAACALQLRGGVCADCGDRRAFFRGRLMRMSVLTR